ncbi:hypothetical protein [Pseudomonas sp. C9-3]|uniref:hypothetical protein n=1 Tax=Pseudomonas sp. C9-3 TaxID=3078264 RepID=UPI0028ECEB23|nr:hypothetical protein [Pseudomonas sp. C9-3]
MEFLLLVAVVTVVFVAMVRRAKRREAELFRRLDEEGESLEQPKPVAQPEYCPQRKLKALSAEQQQAIHHQWAESRKDPIAAAALGLHLELPAKSVAWAKVKPQLAAPKKPRIRAAKPQRPTRAIREGWSIGEVEFLYEDRDGNITFRTVTVHSVSRSALKGECHSKHAERTFRLDRIIGEVTDCETGEIHDPKDWAESMRD